MGNAKKCLVATMHFSGLKMLENTEQPLNVFWIGNHRKCLVASGHFLD
jgi:hypothetical protein